MDIIIDCFLAFAGLILGFLGGYLLRLSEEEINENADRTDKEN